MNIIEQLSESFVLVKNATGVEDNPENVIEWYFNGYPWSSMNCPCCGKTMFRKRIFGQKHPIMVGAHVEVLGIDLFKGYKYIIPLCEECNNKKEKLKPFKVKCGFLKLAPHSV